MTSFGILAAGMAIILAASFIQSLTSFGFALISLPLLSLFLPLQQAVPLIVIFSLVTSLMVVIPNRRHVNVRQVWLLILAGMIAAPFGAYLLLVVSAQTLKAAIGILIALFAALMLLGRSLPIRSERAAFVTAGLLSGLLNGSISVGGPPLALILSNQGMSKQAFRANLALNGVALNIVSVAAFAAGGLLNADMGVFFVWMIPAMLLGVWAGAYAARRFNEKLFKTASLWVILVSGIWTALTGLGWV
ncbi:sulfite exporter TauE/SafE family protein [Saccharibacillus sp. CPCC 101409]|uniref:sulfite exporter TauE/SafE family protein n=1 Tax=Saccharibacillus sp. CPCC 101409 TaxID=3058041 RepID=UPI002671AD17|nr:sulfite exporter TauE/SafE family protein [Saccharibacillus sp. CPCC 101409]MDO3411227.1 sulfite exporter TauE/SafE family protein [Saccharibacillus sp. CPCC 101409]